MTIAIIAADYPAATQAAANLGLKADEWIYPADVTAVRGYIIESVMYVEGWRASETLTPEIMQAVQVREIFATEVELSNPYGSLQDELLAKYAQATLAAERRKAIKPAAPFLDLVQPIQHRNPRPSWWRRLLGISSPSAYWGIR